jgi:hypothetical protein
VSPARNPAFETFLASLAPANQLWAAKASALIAEIVRRKTGHT